MQKQWIGKVNDTKTLALVGKEAKDKERNERSTIAPNIREIVKVYKKFRYLSKAELKSEILKVIKPESDVTSLDSLFLSLFPDCEAGNDTIENSTEGSAAIHKTATHPGLAGLWLGPLQEKCVGVGGLVSGQSS